MAYKLEKPYTEEQRINFIVQYNHEKGLVVEEGTDALYALEANEIMQDGAPFVDPEYENKLAEAEAERIAMLSLTAADVQRGIYRAKGMDFEDIINFINQNPPAGLDIKALKIELTANNFYRGNAYVDAIGALLGFTKEQLDCFFETNDYTCLIMEVNPSPEEEVEEEIAEEEIVQESVEE